MKTERPTALRTLLASLDITLGLITARSLVLHPEAGDLVVAEIDDSGREHLLIPPAAEAWTTMQVAAAYEGIVIKIASAFRSIERQAELVRSKLQQGMSLPDILGVSAPPGYSEHHSGCAVDVATDDSRALEQAFERTAAYAWLADNAGRFGFYLSYPPNNRFGYVYEPWHWCFRQPKS